MSKYYWVLGVKVLALAFLMSLLFSLLAVSLIVGKVQGVTEVKGTISSDTTWTKANSPYVFDGVVVVEDGIILTIEPGVTINMGRYWLYMAGGLNARGSGNSNIVFFSDYSIGGTNRPGYVFFTPTSDSWNEQTGLGSIIENAVFNFTHHPAIDISNSAPKINNNTIYGDIDIRRYSTRSPIISGNNITGSIYARSGSSIISNNTISGNNSGIYGGDNNTLIYRNIISGCQIGINIRTENGSPIVERNLITGNSLAGIQIRSGSPIILNNTITSNYNGIYIINDRGFFNSTILNNNICANSQYNINLSIPDDVSAAYNWWGTNDTAEISQYIHDFEDDFNVGKVIFVPFLTELNPEAPAAKPESISKESFDGILVAVIIVALIVTCLTVLVYLIRRK